MTPLNYGYYVVSILSVVGLFIATKVLLGDDWYWFFGCGIVGILTGIAFVYITQYYTPAPGAPCRRSPKRRAPARRPTSSSARPSASRRRR